MASVASVAWTDGADGEPSLAYDLPLNVSDATARLVADGDGAAIEAGQVLQLDYVIFSGTDGTVVFSTYATGAPESVPFSADAMMPSMWNALQGTHVGAQLIFAALDQSTDTGDGLYPTIVMAVTVSGVTTVLDRAEGAAVAPIAGLPVVTLDATGVPSVDLAGLTDATALVVQPLIIGAGAPLVEGQSVTVHYSGWLLDGTQFDSSWGRGAPATFGFVQGGLIDGWVQGLAGQTVGSQVLLIIPPDLGYADAGSGIIPGGATLVFVVDILAAT